MQPMLNPDQIPILEYFLAGLVVALAIGAYLFTRSRNLAPAERFALLLCPAAAFLTIGVVLNAIHHTPDSDWNSSRLAPAVGLLYKFKLYVGRFGPGPVMNTIYPPMAYLVYLPAGLCSTPTSAILTGSCISAALFFIPAMLLCFGRQADRSQSRFSTIGVVLMLGLMQAAVVSKSLHWGAFYIHADAPMLGFTGLACLTLYLNRHQAMPSIATCLTSALCAALAVWSKQTAATLVAMLPVWVLLTHGFRASVRYTLYLIAAVIAFGLLFRMVFGIHSFMYNIFGIASKHPWIFQGPLLVKGMFYLGVEYFCVSAMFVGPLVLALVARSVFNRGVAAEPDSLKSEVEPKLTGGVRALLHQNPWLLFIVMALAAVPTSMLSRIKFGGAWNNFGPTPYFLSLGLIALIMDWYTTNQKRGLRSFNAGLTLVLLVLVLCPLSKSSEENFETFNYIHTPKANRQEQAYQYSLNHPGTAYFPFNPMSTLLGEGKLYHFIFGLTDREWAQDPITDEHFRAGIPANIRYVCIPGHELAIRFNFLLAKLPEFRRQVDIPELPGWLCYER